MEVVSPLSSMNLHCHPIAQQAFEDTQHNLAKVIMNSTTTDKPRAKKQSNEISGAKMTRLAYQEMRSMENITCDTILSDGRRVGEFLLEQWMQKEKKK
uniref:Uncharacterized protein n=1 Tax=viral metagenome TaxID=1070528 RepID=A0A6C0IWZ6_9ZZZZ